MDEIKHTTASIWSLTSLLVDDCEQVLNDLDQVKRTIKSVDDTLVASPCTTSTPAHRRVVKRKGDVFVSPVHRPVSKIPRKSR